MSIMSIPIRALAQATRAIRRAPTPPLSDLIADWLADLGVAGRAKLTRKRHAGELRRHGRWLDAKPLHWSQVDEADIFAYARLGAKRKESTQANTISALKSFYGWLVKHKHRTTDPTVKLKALRRPKPMPKYLSRAQIRTLLAWLAEQPGMKGRRDEIMVLMGLYTGQRAAELANTKWGDMDLDEGTLTIELSKMGYGRATALPVYLVERLRVWQTSQQPRCFMSTFPPIVALNLPIG